MPQLKEYVAGGTSRTDDKGFAAFETLGRRVGGQYDQAGNDLRDIGRAKSAITAGIGRWPFNIIELTQRAAKDAEARAKGEETPQRSAADTGGGGGGFHAVRDRSGRGSGGYGGGGTRGLEELSEGMGALGRGFHRGAGTIDDYDGRGRNQRVEPGSGYAESRTGFGTTASRDGLSALELQRRDRQAQLDELASQKRWDAYEKNLATYNKDILDSAQKSTPYGDYPTTNDPKSDYYNTDRLPSYADPNSQLYSPSPQGGDYGGGSTTPEPVSGYGGTGSSSWFSSLWE